MNACPLCLSVSTQLIKSFQSDQKKYYECRTCGLVFLDRKNLLPPHEEKARYDHHNNSPDDERYVNFLNRLVEPLTGFLTKGMMGLDYGCGPGPAINHMMTPKGFNVVEYDPYYFPDKILLKRTYDFVTCTEAIEHFYQPSLEFELFDRLLKVDGYLGILDQFLTDDINFDTWWYKKDPTHVSFYRPKTMQWVADKFDWSICHQSSQTVIFLKKTE